MSADIVDVVDDGSLELELFSWYAMTSKGTISSDWVGEFDVILWLTWSTLLTF